MTDLQIIGAKAEINIMIQQLNQWLDIKTSKGLKKDEATLTLEKQRNGLKAAYITLESIDLDLRAANKRNYDLEHLNLEMKLEVMELKKFIELSE